MERSLDAAAIVGLLADADRRRVFAALEMGSRTLDSIEEATGLHRAMVITSIGRFIEAGLVDRADGSLIVRGEVFQVAAREAATRPSADERAGLPDEIRRVMAAFVVDGRLRSIPAVQSKRVVVLDWLAQDFDVGARRSEKMVNVILGKRPADTAYLRCLLVDHDLLSREAGEYWRSGGSTLS